MAANYFNLDHHLKLHEQTNCQAKKLVIVFPRWFYRTLAWNSFKHGNHRFK